MEHPERSKVDAYFHATEGIWPTSREVVEQVQLRKLNRLLQRLHEHSRFYHDLPSSVSSLHDLRLLPFTTASDLALHADALGMVSQSQVARMITDTTSGTTGTPKRMAYTSDDRRRTLQFFAIGLTELVREGDVVLLGFPPSGALGLTDLLQRSLGEIGAVAVVPDANDVLKAIAGGTGGAGDAIDAGNRLLSASRAHGATVYVGLPQVMESLLAACDASRTGLPFRQTLISGDACSAALSHRVEQACGQRPFIHYGSREMGLAAAVDCGARCGMHVRENDLLFEVLDRNGHPVEPGQWGELVVTTIGAQAMPLLRYRTGDRGRIVPQACECGSVLQMIDHDVSRLRV